MGKLLLMNSIWQLILSEYGNQYNFEQQAMDVNVPFFSSYGYCCIKNHLLKWSLETNLLPKKRESIQHDNGVTDISSLLW